MDVDENDEENETDEENGKNDGESGLARMVIKLRR